MKKTLIIILLLLPFLVKSQTVVVPPSLDLSSNTYSAHAPINSSGTGSVTIIGDSINSNNTSAPCIKLSGYSQVTIKRCKVLNSLAQGILLINCKNILIDSCYATNVSDGVHVNGYAGFVVNGCNVHDNYFKNVNGPFPLGNFIQFNNINGAGIRMNHNYGENINGVALHPQDLYSVYQCNGLSTDSIQIWNNYARGGQILHDSGGAAGIVVGDVGGSWQSCRGNYVIDPGPVGIQCQGGHDIKVDHNYIYGSTRAYSFEGLESGNYSGTTTYNINMSYNRINWKQPAGNQFNLWYDSSGSNPLPAGWSTNTTQSFVDAAITNSMLPTVLVITGSAIAAPSISYTTPNTYATGTVISLSPVNIGGSATSYTISISPPAGTSFNTSTGVLSGTVTTPQIWTGSVSATNASGTGSAPLAITVTLASPAISYSSPQTYATGTTITPLSPVSTGGTVASYSVTGALPAGLMLNTSTGVISGTPTAASSATVYQINATNATATSHFNLTLTVNAPTLTAPSITYAVANDTATYGHISTTLYPVNSGGAVTTWSIDHALPAGMSFNNGVVSGTPTVVSANAAYVITATNSIGSSSFTLHIYVKKSPLIISAISKSKRQGTVNPTLYYSFNNGLVNGDTTIDTTPVLNTSCTTSSPVGQYDIVPSGAASTKYSITYSNGKLTVYSGVLIIGYTVIVL